MSTALLVDEVLRRRLLLKWFLGAFGHRIDTAATGDEALAILDPERHELVISDLASDSAAASELARRVKTRAPQALFLSVAARAPDGCSCLDELLLNPTDVVEFADAVDRLLERGVGRPRD